MMRIVTHNGKIHADECAAVSLLSSYFANKGVEVYVLRTRDASKFLDSDCLVDVGGEYDHTRLRYDHHQSDFSEKWNTESSSLLSSAGLIWRHYGREIIEMYLSNNAEQYDYGFNYSETTIEELLNIIYEKLILEIDAHDNGISIIGGMNISELICAVNCNDVSDDETQNANFNRAVSLIGNIFDIKFKEIINSYFNFHRDLEVVKSILRDDDKQKGYLIVNENIPTIFKCLNEIDPICNIRFCIFFNKDKNEYTIKARRTLGQKFLPVCPIIPEEKLKSLLCSDCEDIIFVHKASFLAKTRSLTCAEKIVQLSLQNEVHESISEESFEENICISDTSNSEQKCENKNLKFDISIVKENKLATGLALGSIAAFSYFYFTNKND